MATMTGSVETVPAPALRLEARWVPVVERGRRRLVMQWYVPDADEALRATVAAGS